MTIYIDHGGEEPEGAFPVAGLDGWAAPLEGQGQPEALSSGAKPRALGHEAKKGVSVLLEQALAELEGCCQHGDEPLLTCAEARAISRELARLRRAAGEREWGQS